jgi:hypothetical protein
VKAAGNVARYGLRLRDVGSLQAQFMRTLIGGVARPLMGLRLGDIGGAVFSGPRGTVGENE